MSEGIDWENDAPEGATHFRLSQRLWYKQTDRAFVWSASRWELLSNDLGEFRWSEDLIERPKAWTGEGLPPVGTVCLDNSGSKIVIVAHHANGTHAIFAEAMDAGLLYYGAAGDFRPIRTPEQIAADEREAAVAAMLELDPYLPNAALGMMSRLDFCRALYDAGYLKPATAPKA